MSLILHHFRDIIDYFPKIKEVTLSWGTVCQSKG